MRLKLISVLFASVILVACSAGESDSSASSASLQTTLATLPATIEGQLIAGSSEGDDSGIAGFTVGSITVGEDAVDVLIPPDMLKAAALPDDVGNVRATLGSVTTEYGGGSPYYKVTKLERL